MLRRTTIAVAAALMAVLFPAAASAHPHARDTGGIPIFRVDGTHGFKIDIWTTLDNEHHPPEVVISIWKRNSQTTYSVPGEIGPQGFAASFRRFGWIDVHYRPGPPMTVKNCRGQSVKAPGGRFTGVFEFHGDYHFTVADYPSLNVRPLSPFADSCVGGSTGRGKGARLVGFSLAGKTEAIQNRPGGPVRFIASAGEEFGSLKIQRYIQTFGPAKDFVWSPKLRSARITPPAPFHGSASFSASRRHDNWRGNVTVDFPGFRGFPIIFWSPTAALLEPESCKIDAPNRPVPPIPCV
jgi:hypothetical protein